MSYIVGMDAGNSEVKVFGEKGALKFASTLSEAWDLDLGAAIKKTSEEYNIWEYEGEKGFGGKLAQREGLAKRNTRGTTKNNDDVLIRVLIALHRYGKALGGDDSFKFVIGNPVVSHNSDTRKAIKRLLEGKHMFKLNGSLREIVIDEVEVVPEGGLAFWSRPKDGLRRVLDFGSGTVNGVTVEDKDYTNSQSFTVDKGMESDKRRITPEVLWKMTYAMCLDKSWQPDDIVDVVGGAADIMLPLVQTQFRNAAILNPTIVYGDSAKEYPAIYANAIGAYELAKDLFE